MYSVQSNCSTLSQVRQWRCTNELWTNFQLHCYTVTYTEANVVGHMQQNMVTLLIWQWKAEEISLLS